MSDIATFTDAEGRQVSTTVGSPRHLAHLAAQPPAPEPQEQVEQPDAAEPERPRSARRRASSET